MVLRPFAEGGNSDDAEGDGLGLGRLGPGGGGDSDFGAKTIGLLGSVTLLANNLAGPTVALLPALAQEAGWLAMVAVMIILAVVSTLCGVALLEAMRVIPGNQNFGLRVEYTDLVRQYLPNPWGKLTMLCYHVYLIMTLMTYIISTAQVIDFASLDAFGCAYGLELGPAFRGVCGTAKDSSTPFGEALILPASFVAGAVICTPFAIRNLDDNVTLQVMAIGGFTVIAAVWVLIFAARLEARGPTALSLVTASQGPLWGVLLFNFAFMSTLPSWVNEKKPSVSAGWSFFFTMSYIVIVYSAVGILGGLAYAPYFETDATLFSKLNASGSRLAQFTVFAYPVLQNFTSIPVFSILIRYNLVRSGVGRWIAIAIAVPLPWVASVLFYTGKGFETISEFGGLVTSSVVNFLVPTAMFALSRQRLRKRPGSGGALGEGGTLYELAPSGGSSSE